LEKEVDIILLQEPYLPKIKTTWVCPSHAAYYPVLPQPGQPSNIQIKPRVLTYIRKRPGLEFNPEYTNHDPDFQVIRVINSTESFYIFNIYNGHREDPTPYTLDRLLQVYPEAPTTPTLIVGDFNLHHP
jgi:hypothetical protein